MYTTSPACTSGNAWKSTPFDSIYLHILHVKQLAYDNPRKTDCESSEW